MFETEIQSDGSLIAFIVQQLAVCVGSVVWAAISAPLPYALAGMGVLGRTLETASIFALALGPAFLCGRLIRSKRRQFAYSGRWVWLLPTALLLVLLLSSPSKLSRNLGELFFPPSEGEAWWAVLVFTYPTLGSLSYSFGVRSYGSSRK